MSEKSSAETPTARLAALLAPFAKLWADSPGWHSGRMDDLATGSVTVGMVRQAAEVHAALAGPAAAPDAASLRRALAELQAWGREIHDALDGKPLPAGHSEAAARIAALTDKAGRVTQGETR